VALGSNLGDREAHLALARARIAALPGTRLVAVSRIDETAPLGPVPQGRYLNQMALLETTLEPDALLHGLRDIEAAAGRVRSAVVRWGPRTLDLDIVRFGDRELSTAELTVPHPELPRRDFWQREITELDGVQP
jgi:2-amino-4-hydroxy-6-hydroxymethyldihydropteridine diphosphokinase